MLNRSIVNRLRYVLEDLLPPALRDSRLFYLLMHLALGRRTRHYVAFRARSPYMTAEEYDAYYRSYVPLLEKTDLNDTCVTRILTEAVGESVLDAGCGRGYLAELLAKQGRAVTALDFQIARAIPAGRAVEGAVERLPFRDAQFDTVICTHTLEHIIAFDRAVAELRRVCRRKLILVVPREREYKYSFNLHVHFFPYPHTLLNRLHPLPAVHACEVLDGDLMYVEQRV